jgi:serine/threonine protein phosphatase PrpC
VSPLASFIAFSKSEIGHSHLKKQRPCQDYSLCITEKDYQLIAVADGHGGDQYFRSQFGSQFAVNAVKDCMTDLNLHKELKKTLKIELDIVREKNQNKLFFQLKQSILSNWSRQVANHFDANPFTETELEAVPENYSEKYRNGEKTESAYGSTLIAALRTSLYLLVMQIGDGNCVVVDKDKKFKFLEEELIDEKCFLNTTTSLCDNNVLEVFHHDLRPTPPSAVLIGTDGVDDSLGNEEGLYNFYRTILKSFSEKDEETAKNELFGYLPRLSEKGSGDDISVAAIIDQEWLQTQNFDVPPDIGQYKTALVQEPNDTNLQNLQLDRNILTGEDQKWYETEKLAGKMEPIAGGQEMSDDPAQEAQAEYDAAQDENARAAQTGMDEGIKDENGPNR